MIDSKEMKKNQIRMISKVEKSVVKVKPQLVFQDKPDNSTLPFVPKLFEKVTKPTQLYQLFSLDFIFSQMQ